MRGVGGGGDEQSIYSFRKAAPEGIRRFAADYPGAVQYPLSVTRRCPSRIVTWARFVIDGDPDRAPDRAVLTATPEAPEGEVALLRFGGQAAEARGVAGLIRHLVSDERIYPSDILVLTRGDRGGRFSTPIKDELEGAGIPVADTQMVERCWGRLVTDGRWRCCGSWYSPMTRLRGPLYVGSGTALDRRSPITSTRAREIAGLCLGEHCYSPRIRAGRGSSAAARGRATALVTEVRAWMTLHGVPDEPPGEGWGQWILSVPTDEVYAGFSTELAGVIEEVNNIVEPDVDLQRFLSQLGPLGGDLMAEHGGGVRFMSMTRSKGLTVDATIVVACEEDIMPRPEAALAEERRLLYVAMTRARRFLYCTWAQRRTGPTARAGSPRVQGRQTVSSLLRSGPVLSQDGAIYVAMRSQAAATSLRA